MVLNPYRSKAPLLHSDAGSRNLYSSGRGRPMKLWLVSSPSHRPAGGVGQRSCGRCPHRATGRRGRSAQGAVAGVLTEPPAGGRGQPEELWPVSSPSHWPAGAVGDRPQLGGAVPAGAVGDRPELLLLGGAWPAGAVGRPAPNSEKGALPNSGGRCRPAAVTLVTSVTLVTLDTYATGRIPACDPFA